MCLYCLCVYIVYVFIFSMCLYCLCVYILYVFAEYGLFYRALLPKRPMILRILQMVAPRYLVFCMVYGSLVRCMLNRNTMIIKTPQTICVCHVCDVCDVSRWRVVFDDERVGAEDLEEEEILRFIKAFDSHTAQHTKKRAATRSVGNSAARRSGGRESRGAKRARKSMGEDDEEEEVADEKAVATGVGGSGTRGDKASKVRRVLELRGKKVVEGKVSGWCVRVCVCVCVCV